MTQSALLQALGWSLLNSLWQMGLLWFIYKVSILLFPDISARSRHGLILSLLAAGTSWSVLSFVSADTGFIFAGTGVGFITAGTSAAGIFPVLAPFRSFMTSFLPYGSSLYLLILAGLLIRYCYHYFYSTTLTRKGLSRIGPVFRVFVAETSRRMGIRPEVKVWLSKLIDVPVTLGFFKPVILLPFAMAGQLTTEQVEAILVHELAHIRRNDFLLNLGVTLLEGLFFFNPFTRWFITYLKKQREYCCDDLVLLYRYDPQTYVSALLSVARQASQDQPTRLAVAATGSGSNQLLLQRAKRILQQQRMEERPGIRPFVLLVLTVLISLVSLSRPARSLPEQAPSLPVVTVVAVVQPLKQVDFATASPSDVQNAPLISNTPPPHAANRVTHPRHPAPPPGPMVQLEDDQPAEAPPPLITTFADADLVRQEEFVTIIRKDTRDYSMGKSRSVNRTPAKEEGQPFVPKSSFSFLSIDEDTLRPDEKLARVQIQTQREIVLNMQKLQLGLMAQLELVKARQHELQDYDLPDNVQGIQGLKEQQVIIEEQLRLRQVYIRKLDELQKKLKKAQRHLTIVYI